MESWQILAAIDLGAVMLALAIVARELRRDALALRRERVIRACVFSTEMFRKPRALHTQLTVKDCPLVAKALREFFLACSRSGRRLLGMPSRVPEDLWHEFIRHTREYAQFCQAAFGGYLHHVPAAATGKSRDNDEALRLTWGYACMGEGIDPSRPTRLPLLSAIDGKLKIERGCHYGLRRRAQAAAGEPAGACGGFACAGDGLIGERFPHAGGSSGDGCGGGGCGGD
jgi:hypothetical protein